MNNKKTKAKAKAKIKTKNKNKNKQRHKNKNKNKNNNKNTRNSLLTTRYSLLTDGHALLTTHSYRLRTIQSLELVCFLVAILALALPPSYVLISSLHVLALLRILTRFPFTR